MWERIVAEIADPDRAPAPVIVLHRRRPPRPRRVPSTVLVGAAAATVAAGVAAAVTLSASSLPLTLPSVLHLP